MCEPLLLKAAKRGDSYDFSGMFSYVKELIAQSDYVVGNLETPLAGKKAGIVNELFSFNAPDEFAKAVKEAGVDFVSTANNHCMDRGLDGLKRTVKVLDDIGLSHDGTHVECDKNEPFIADVKGLKLAVIPATYGTNYGVHHRELSDKRYVDLLHSDTEPVYIRKKKGKKNIIKKIMLKPFKEEQIAAIKKKLGLTYNSPRKDDFIDEKTAQPFFARLESKVVSAKKEADLVVFYPHVGGQFNLEPGIFTRYTVDKALEYGVDAVIASHPHIIQKTEFKNNIPIFYSIGNFSMSPNSVYLLYENLPEFGLIVHLYIEDKKIVKTTFSIIKIIETKREMMKVYPINVLWDKLDDNGKKELKKQIAQICSVVYGRECSNIDVQAEYDLL